MSDQKLINKSTQISVPPAAAGQVTVYPTEAAAQMAAVAWQTPAVVAKSFTLPSPSKTVRTRNDNDVAAYILQKCGTMSVMKLQKLVYYAQAWSLVWDERPMFDERIEAWANGPVVPTLYEKHKGKYQESVWVWGDIGLLDKDAISTLDAVIEHYAGHSAQWLSDLTHQERPWQEARVGLDAGERGTREISHESMREYYTSLSPQNV